MLAIMLVALGVNGCSDSKPSGSSVTVKLPPPKAAASPGFSDAIKL